MPIRTVYCSACDQNVRVALLHPPDLDAATDPTAFVCLECGAHCSGTLCPVTTLPPATTRDPLAQGGLALP